MNNKKILFVTPYFYPQMGGLENYVLNIASGLVKSGWKVIVVTSNHLSKNIQTDMVGEIKVYKLPILFKLSNTPINPLWYFYIKSIIRNERPDIINAHEPVPFIADMAALAAGTVPFVLTYHAGTMKKRKLFQDILISLYENIFLKYILGKAVKIICPSRFVINTLLNKYRDKCYVISPAVDLDVFKPFPKRRKAGNTVIFICRYANMARMKGFYTLVNAMKMLPYASLKVIGEPGSIKYKNVNYLGVKYGKDLVKEVQSSDVFVLASLAHMESFGMVLIEAMACKVPVVGTRIGGIPEIISDGVDGYIVSPENPNELATAIGKILRDKKLAKRMGDAAYKKVISKYTWKTKIYSTARLFKSCI